ncbi:GNAT family N-acetyltransferase [Knoellia locipacati]|uniref:GNAT family N-acetyltransferase n=1 Tax=Knoellia locipacati TaxID=882824 RepID=UPI003850B901
MISARELVLRAWRGPDLPADGSWVRMSPWRPDLYAVLAVNAHAAVSAPDEVTDAELSSWGVDGFGGAHDPRVMTRLAGQSGWVDVLDAVLVAPGTGSSPLVARPDLADHPRVRHAAEVRDAVRVLGWPDRDDVVVTVGDSLGGLPVVSYEVAPSARGVGLGGRTVAAARGLVPEGEPVVALVAPGNTPSLRAALRAGFVPVGSVQLYAPEGRPGGADESRSGEMHS